jgi:hypothetical protein
VIHAALRRWPIGCCEQTARSDRRARTQDHVPRPCQKEQAKTCNHEHSRDIRTTPELHTRSCWAWWQQSDKDEVGGSSPPRPTQVTSPAVKQSIAPVGGWPSRSRRFFYTRSPQVPQLVDTCAASACFHAAVPARAGHGPAGPG